MPELWKPASVDDAALVLCQKRSVNRIERCSYEDDTGRSYTVNRYQIVYERRLSEAKTGVLIVDERDEGSMPESCPLVLELGFFSASAGSDDWYGSDPDTETWLEPYVGAP